MIGYERKDKEGYWRVLSIHKDDIINAVGKDCKVKAKKLTDAQLNNIAEKVEEAIDNDLQMYLREAFEYEMEWDKMSKYFCGNCQSSFPNKDCPKCLENFECDDDEL
jgi:hypothetical protein